MRGRAGRKGKDEIGETYLCCQKSDVEEVSELMEADIPNVESCLVPGKRGINRYYDPSCLPRIHISIPRSRLTEAIRALLEVVATRLATCDDSVNDYMKKTLLYHSIDSEELASVISSTLDDLSKNGLVKTDGITYEATTLGMHNLGVLLLPRPNSLGNLDLFFLRPAFPSFLNRILSPMGCSSDFALF
jgi:DNA polymerase theta